MIELSATERLARANMTAGDVAPDVRAMIHVGIAQAMFLSRIADAIERIANTIEERNT